MKRVLFLILAVCLYPAVMQSQTCGILQYFHEDSLLFNNYSTKKISFEKDSAGQFHQIFETYKLSWGTIQPIWTDTIKTSQPVSFGDKVEFDVTAPYLKSFEKEHHFMGGETRLYLKYHKNYSWSIQTRVLSGDPFVEKYPYYGLNNNFLFFTTTSGFDESASKYGDTRRAEVEIYDEEYDCRDTVWFVEHYQPYSGTDAGMCYGGILTCQAIGDICEIPVYGAADLPEIYVKHPDFITRLPDRIEGNDRYVRLEVSANESEEARMSTAGPAVGQRWYEIDEDAIYLSMNKTDALMFSFYQPGCNSPTFEEQKEALIALYNATDGDNWNFRDNWLSEAPVTSWFGVNKVGLNGYGPICGYESGSPIYGNYVIALSANKFTSGHSVSSRLHGQLPPEFAKLMTAPHGLHLMNNYWLSSNRLYGDIPEEVKNHPNWPEIGWSVIAQLTTSWATEEKLNLTDSKVKARDGEVDLFVEEKTSTLYDILKQNQLTMVVDMGLILDDGGRAKDANSISDDRVNLYLDYCNKGLGMVATIETYFDTSFDGYRDFVKQRQKEEGLPTGIRWVKGSDLGKDNISGGSMGDVYILDQDGNLVWYWNRIWDDGPTMKEDWYNAQADSIIRSILGEPEEHEPFVSQNSAYQSTDFSQDGEIVILQEASLGQGINVVLMGDLFVDKDMEEGGKYETVMREAMEMLFSTEPFKSLRDRFNVYMIKVVAPNTYTGVYHNVAYQIDDNKCFQYAMGIEGFDQSSATIISILNREAIGFNENVTLTYLDNSSIVRLAGLYDGHVGRVLLHEAGHAIGKLADEYDITNGATRTDDEKEALRNEMYNHFYSFGWGCNVSPTNDPNEVFWAHFLEDSCYADEVGIYDIGNGLYRPSPVSLMNNSWTALWFNAPSREAIYKQIMQLSEGEGWTYDYETFVEFDTPTREAYKDMAESIEKRKKSENATEKAEMPRLSIDCQNLKRKMDKGANYGFYEITLPTSSTSTRKKIIYTKER